MGSVNKKWFNKDFENNFTETLNRIWSSIQRAIQKIWNQQLICRSSYLPYFKDLQNKYSSGETISLKAARSPIEWRCGKAPVSQDDTRPFTPSLFSSFCQGVQGNTLRLGNFFGNSILLIFWCPRLQLLLHIYPHWKCIYRIIRHRLLFTLAKFHSWQMFN